MIPAVIIGLFFEDFIASLFDGKIALVGAMLMITALLLILADRVNENNKKLNYTKAFSIGVIQAIAILPGISRSGATIALAVLLKIDRDKAAQFSFLMVIPLILGSMAKSIMDGDLSQESTALLPLLVGFVSAFITGVFACRWMIALVKKSQLKSFSIYCVAVGVIAILFSL
jgi:undecaprenyl-diphosphatase